MYVLYSRAAYENARTVNFLLYILKTLQLISHSLLSRARLIGFCEAFGLDRKLYISSTIRTQVNIVAFWANRAVSTIFVKVSHF